MPENPFGEGFDLGAMLEQAQQMQSQMMQAQAQLAERRIEGTSGGVTVTVSGLGELVGVQIPTGVVSDDSESLTDLGDLIVAGYRDAKARADQEMAQVMGPLSAGLPGGDPGGPSGV